MDENTKEEIVEWLKGLILTVAPKSSFIAKYGGLIVEGSPGKPESQFCGVFVYKAHVSLEFTHGAHLDDSDNNLEGNGKHRRHVKIASLSDIKDKQCEDFLRQASRVQSGLT